MAEISTGGDEPRERADARALLWGVPLAVALLSHLPSLLNGFVHDDPMLLTHNPHMHGLSGLAALLGGGLFAAMQELGGVEYYRPLSSVLYWLSWQLFGDDSVGQHALNLLLHGGVAVAFGALLRAVGAGDRPSVLGASLFAAHPATADIVAYVGGRQDMLGWLLSLLALRFGALRQPSPRAAVALFTLVLGGCLSREFFLAAPLWLAALCITRPPSQRVAALRYLLGGSGAAVVVTLVLRVAFGIASPSAATVPLGGWLDAFAFVSARVVRAVAWPLDLAVEITVAPTTLAGLPMTLPIVALVLGGGAALVLGVVRRADGMQEDEDAAVARGAAAAVAVSVAVLLATFILHTVPAVRFSIIADRYAYGPVMAAVGLVWGLSVLWSARVPRRAPAVVLVLCIGFVPVAWARDLDFESDETLSMALLRNRPNDPQSWIGAGTVLFLKGDVDAAYPLCERYRRAMPRSSRANLCVGEYLLSHGQPRRAAAVLESYVRVRSGHMRGRRALVGALMAAGEVEAAGQAVQWLERRHPGAPDLAEARALIERAPARVAP